MSTSNVEAARDTNALHLAEQKRSLDLGDDAERRLIAISQQQPSDIAIAYQRFVEWRRIDPFPEIPCGLLHGAAICDYVLKSGMLFECSLSRKTVKIASLDLELLGKIVYFEGKKRKILNIGSGDLFELPRNAIAFVTLRPYIQLPDYMAMRFNLRIKNIYRGLLLGTGPIVDPGFQGRLSFPLHNLTDNAYVFTGGEPIITAEFTKLALPRMPAVDGDKSGGQDVGLEPGEAEGQATDTIVAVSEHPKSSFRMPYPEPKRISYVSSERDVESFLAKGSAPGPVVSSLAPLRKKIVRFGRILTSFGWLGVVSLVLTLLSVTAAIFNATTHANQAVAEAMATLKRDSVVAREQRIKLDSVRSEQLRMKEELNALRKALTGGPSRAGSSP